MESIGSYLKKQREMRSISLQDVSKATKINLKSLTALETDDFGFLPGQVFAKGFVRSYAKAIGLNVEEALLQLEENLEESSKISTKGNKISWLSQKSLKSKPWIYFILFLFVVLTAAYISSR